MKLLYVHADSPLSATDADQYYSRLKATDGVHLCNKLLTDLPHPNVNVKNVPIKSVRTLGNMFHHAPLLPPGTKIAFVVNSTLMYGFVRLFMGSRGDGVIIRPFRKKGDALAWLQVSEDDLPSPLVSEI